MSARQITLAAIGTVVALAGFEHGVGEFLQSPVAPAGLVIQSWPQSEFYRSLQGVLHLERQTSGRLQMGRG